MHSLEDSANTASRPVTQCRWPGSACTQPWNNNCCLVFDVSSGSVPSLLGLSRHTLSSGFVCKKKKKEKKKGGKKKKQSPKEGKREKKTAMRSCPETKRYLLGCSLILESIQCRSGLVAHINPITHIYKVFFVQREAGLCWDIRKYGSNLWWKKQKRDPLVSYKTKCYWYCSFCTVPMTTRLCYIGKL